MTTLKNANLITALASNVHSAEAPRTYCIIINTLTGVACSALMRHIGQERRGELDIPGHIPTLDERNEMDETTRGEEISDFLTNASGFNKALPAMKVAQICDGIRYSMYQEMHAWDEFAESNALYITPTQSITARVNYNQPMSAQLYMEYRIKLASTVNQLDIDRAVKMLKQPEALIRQAFTDEALKTQQRLKEMKPRVLSEIQSFEDVYDDSAFDLLDIETRCAIAEKIAGKYDAQFMRLLPRAVRSLDAASELNMIQVQHELTKQWLLDNDKELQDAMLIRKAA